MFVTKCTHPAAALSILRERIGCYDAVIADVYKPNMNGFELLKIFCQEMHLPVIMMSANCDVDVAMRGLENEARYHLKKPVSVGEVKNIWQPIIRKSKEDKNDIEEIGSFGEIRQMGSSSEENDNPDAAAGWGSSVDHVEMERHKTKKGALGVRIDAKGKNVYTAERKAHICWDAVLHNNLVKSIDQIGIDSTVPTKIVQRIDASGLSLKNVASHLQEEDVLMGDNSSSYNMDTLSEQVQNPTFWNSSEDQPFGSSTKDTVFKKAQDGSKHKERDFDLNLFPVDKDED